MSDDVLEVDVANWVERAKADPITHLQRQAAEITLNAIALAAPLNAKLVLKGGILMGLAYDSPRQTGDIDLTAELKVDGDVANLIQTSLDVAFPYAAAELGYADLVVKTHSIKKQPKKIFEKANFPALKLKVAYARRGTKQEKALKNGKSPDIIDVDISFNEELQQVQLLELTGGRELLAYSLVDLVAEKFRAMLQQVDRNRNRRQDVYDLNLLIKHEAMTHAPPAQILESFLIKCRSRNIEASQQSLDDPEVRRRSAAEWDTMKLELGEVPDFEECYAVVDKFYRNLPWEKN